MSSSPHATPIGCRLVKGTAFQGQGFQGVGVMGIRKSGKLGGAVTAIWRESTVSSWQSCRGSSETPVVGTSRRHVNAHRDALRRSPGVGQQLQMPAACRREFHVGSLRNDAAQKLQMPAACRRESHVGSLRNDAAQKLQMPAASRREFHVGSLRTALSEKRAHFRRPMP